MKITPVKKRLVARGWTQRKIVQATGRHKTEISAVLNGRRYTNSTQKDIAQVVGLSVQELFGDWSYSKRQRKEKKIIKKMDGGGGLWQRQFPHYQAVIYSCKPSGDCGITFISDGVASLLGYEPCEFAKDARLWADHIHPEDAPRVLANLRQLVKHGYYTQEYRFLHKNGTYRWMHDEMKLVRDEAGKPLEIVGCWIDITKHPQGEVAPEDSDEPAKKYRIQIEAANDAVFLVDIKTRIILDVNKRVEMLLGIPVEEIIGKHHTQLYPVEERERNNKLFQKYAQLKHSVTSEDIFVQHKDGSRVPVEISSSVIELGGKKVIQGIFRDVTGHKQTEEKLQAMARVFIEATDAIVIEDLHRKIVDVNAEVERVYGWTRGELLGKSIDIIIPQEKRKQQLELRSLCLQGEDVRNIECFRLKKSGEVLNLLLTLSLLSDDAGNPGAIATIAKDITARKQAEEKIKHMDCYDSLTGLSNHKLFKELLSRAIANAHRHEHPLAVLFLDLDNFKDVNSTLGHTVGDRLLKAAADRLKWSVRAEGTVARMVGVEFAVLLPEIAGAEGATTVAQKVLETIGELVTLNNHKLNITTSIGIAFYPEAGEDPEVLLRNADIAMCAAKKQGGNNLQFYTT